MSRISDHPKVLDAYAKLRDKSKTEFRQIKPHLPFTRQLELLESRGLIIKDEEAMLGLLQRIGYYHLSGYTLTLKDDKDRFLEGTTSEKLIAIYAFDQKMRDLLHSYIDRIEVSFRTLVSYYHTQKFGPLGYMDPASFLNGFNHAQFIEQSASEILRQHRMPCVAHHLLKYDREFPLWVLMEILTFGQVTKLYVNMPISIRGKIAKNYGLTDEQLRSFSRCISDLRNACAHNGRLYYQIFTSLPNKSTCQPVKKRYDALNLREHHLFWQMYPIKKMLLTASLRDQLLADLTRLIKDNRHIELESIGFPADWEDYYRQW